MSTDFAELYGLVRSPWAIMALLGGLFLTLFTARTIQYIWFHPLSKYPRPWYAATTNLVYYLVEISGNMVPWISAQHARYGDVVRLGPTRLSFTDPAAWPDIYGGRGKGANPQLNTFPKDPWFYAGVDGLNAGGEPNVVTALDDAHHARVRRLFGPAFSEQALRRQGGMLARHADALVARIRKDMAAAPERGPDAVRVFNFATFDIMSELVFGEDLGMLAHGEYVCWVSNVFESLKAMTVSAFPIGRYQAFGAFVRKYLIPPAARRMIHAHMQFVVDRVDARARVTLDKPDLWALVMMEQERSKERRLDGDGGDEAAWERPLTRNELYSNAAVFMLAVSETSATLLSGLTYLLLKSPERMRRLTGEVRSLRGEGKLTLESLSRLEYLNACIQEALRVFPPVPLANLRLSPPGGAVVCGEYIPGNMHVGMYHHAAYHSAANFRDLDSFIPERWLPGSQYESDRKEILQPFAFGPRNCVGKSLAQHEMRLLLAKVLRHFDLELMPESEGWMDNMRVYTLWEKPPLKARATPAGEAGS